MGTVRHPHLGATFCASCAGPLSPGVLCPSCGVATPLAPRPCTGLLATREDGRILLVRRDIEPRRGLWQAPGGFMEADESPEEAVRRELREEANLEVGPLSLLGVFTAVELGLFVVCYEAPALTSAAAGDEVQEIGWFTPGEIPWAELSFTSTERAIRAFLSRHGHAAPGALVTTWGG